MENKNSTVGNNLKKSILCHTQPLTWKTVLMVFSAQLNYQKYVTNQNTGKASL